MKLWVPAVKSTNSSLPVGKLGFWHQPSNATLSFFFFLPTCANSLLLTVFWTAAPLPLPEWIRVITSPAAGFVVLKHISNALRQMRGFEWCRQSAQSCALLLCTSWSCITYDMESESMSSTKIMLISIKACKKCIVMLGIVILCWRNKALFLNLIKKKPKS